MNAAHSAHEILEIMLRHLGYSVTIEMDEDPSGPSLHVRMEKPESLIGRKGERLDDLQHLVNKLLRQKFRKSGGSSTPSGNWPPKSRPPASPSSWTP